jgi:hypothetical protein
MIAQSISSRAMTSPVMVRTHKYTHGYIGTLVKAVQATLRRKDYTENASGMQRAIMARLFLRPDVSRLVGLECLAICDLQLSAIAAHPLIRPFQQTTRLPVWRRSAAPRPHAPQGPQRPQRPQ